MSSLQPLTVDFAPYNSADFALLPSPASFFSAQSAFNQLPPAAAYAASPPSDQVYYSDSNSAPSPANSFDYSSLSQSSRSVSPATSLEPSPKLENALLPCNSHNLGSVGDYQHQHQHAQPLAPLSLVDASAILASSAQQKAAVSLVQDWFNRGRSLTPRVSVPQYESYDYQQDRVQHSQTIHAPVAQYPSQYSSQAPLSLPIVHQQLAQVGYNSSQSIYQHPQSSARNQDLGASATPYYLSAAPQAQVHPQYAQHQQHAFAAPPPSAPFMATPSFETPQGTFYFVPNTSVQQPSAGIPVPSGLPMPMGMSHSRSQSSTSWDGDVDDSKPKPAVKKQPKKASGKNQTKRFVSCSDILLLYMAHS